MVCDFGFVCGFNFELFRFVSILFVWFVIYGWYVCLLYCVVFVVYCLVCWFSSLLVLVLGFRLLFFSLLLPDADCFDVLCAVVLCWLRACVVCMLVWFVVFRLLCGCLFGWFVGLITVFVLWIVLWWCVCLDFRDWVCLGCFTLRCFVIWCLLC